MEIVNVQMPNEDFNLLSYIEYYKGLIIALNRFNNAIGYITLSENKVVFNTSNTTDYSKMYDDFEELLRDNTSIEHLKLIEFYN